MLLSWVENLSVRRWLNFGSEEIEMGNVKDVRDQTKCGDSCAGEEQIGNGDLFRHWPEDLTSRLSTPLRELSYRNSCPVHHELDQDRMVTLEALHELREACETLDTKLSGLSSLVLPTLNTESLGLSDYEFDDEITDPEVPAKIEGPSDHGLKFDDGKPMFRLLPPTALKQVAEVLTFGAKKYAPDNWRKVDGAADRYLDAALRHLNSHMLGEELDPESGLSHYAHAATNLMFLIELQAEEAQQPKIR